MRRASSAPDRSIPSIPDPTNINAVADWAEFYLVTIRPILARATLKRFLEEMVGGETGYDLDGVWQELERRQALYGAHPPFVIEGEHLTSKIKWGDRPDYMMCLLLSLLGNGKEAVKTGMLFEEVAEKIICRYLQAKSIPYGRTRPRLKVVAGQLNEKFIEEPTGNFKDRGVDIIAWKPFQDGRPSQLVLLLQCAGGWNWRQKTRDIPYDAWIRYIHWGSNPLKGFAMPGIFPRNLFDDIAMEAGIILDRARFFQSYTAGDISKALRDRIAKWCRKKIPSVGRT